MTILFLTEFNTKDYGVTFLNKGRLKVQKFEDKSPNKNIIYIVNPLETFLGKSESCEMTAISGAFDKSVFDGNTTLLKISEEFDKHRYFYIGGDMICTFLTNDKIYKYASNMGNNLTLYSIAVGYKNVYFLTPHFEFVKRKLVIDVDLLNAKENSLDPFDYHASNCGEHSFKQLQLYKILSNYD